MIKIVSAAYHANIGDNRSARLLEGFIKTISPQDVTTVGYVGSEFNDQQDVEKFCSGANTIIIGTGGCFYYTRIGDYNKVFYANDPELYKFVTCPLIIMSTGFNRDYETFDWSNEWKETMHALLERADLIGMRTTEDQQLAISLGADRSKTFCCPDPLLFIGSNMEDHHNNKAVVSLYTDRWLIPVTTQILKYGYEPVYSDHESSSFRFSEYANCNFVVTKRFHGQMLAFAFGKPCFSIDQNIKHRFARQMLYKPDLYYYADNHLVGEELESKFQEFIANKERMRCHIAPRREIVLKGMFTDFLLKVEGIINV